MEDYIVSLFEAMSSYFSMASNSTQWWLVPVTIVLLWLLITISTKFIGDHKVFTREFKIHTFSIVVGVCVELSLIGYFLYSWISTEKYQTDHEKLVHLLCILSCIVVQVMSYKKLANGLQKERLKQNVRHPVTEMDSRRKRKIVTQQFKKMKLWSILPILGFLVLLLPIKRDKNLVSFLLDNSSSMDVHLNNGKQILEKAFKNLDSDTDIVLSWFSENNPRTDFQKLIRSKDQSQLDGIHQYFTNNESAIQSLNSIEFTETTPLYESIWSNYLYTKALVQNKDYTNKIFVMVTDGEDSYFQQESHSFLCAVADFNDFYKDYINIINLQGLDNTFFEKAEDCNYIVYEGMDLDSYSTAIQEILVGVTKDYYFPAWLCILCVSGMTIVLLIKPKRH